MRAEEIAGLLLDLRVAMERLSGDRRRIVIEAVQEASVLIEPAAGFALAAFVLSPGGIGGHA